MAHADYMIDLSAPAPATMVEGSFSSAKSADPVTAHSNVASEALADYAASTGDPVVTLTRIHVPQATI
jgi:hypothetical protein